MEELLRALPALLNELDENEAVREAVVMAVWRKIAGNSLRDHAVPFRLYKNHLIVAVTSEMWKKHLESLSSQMIFKVNSMLKQPAVKFIEFRVDEKTVRQHRAANKKTGVSQTEFEETALDEVSAKLRRSADAIEDDNLRYNFLLAAGGCLSRKKKLLSNE